MSQFLALCKTKPFCSIAANKLWLVCIQRSGVHEQSDQGAQSPFPIDPFLQKYPHVILILMPDREAKACCGAARAGGYAAGVLEALGIDATQSLMTYSDEPEHWNAIFQLTELRGA